jgi:acetyl esterase/lipase
MPSLRSRLFVFTLKHRHLLQFKRKRPATVDWNTSIPQLRQETEAGAGFFGKFPADLRVTPVAIGDLHAEWIRAEQSPRDAALLYFHGGGYVIGSSQSHRQFVAKYVKGSGVAAFVPDYRLAPEHPFPAALDDAVVAYRYLLDEGISPANIVVGGDSAGGGLCLATLLALRDQGLPLPSGTVALSPWTDLANTGESLRTNAAVDTLTWAESWTVFSKYYVGDQDPRRPWISPLYGDLHGLPPLLLYVGGDELLRDDATRFAAKAQAAGVDVTLHVGEGLFHCYPVCAPLFPEATQAMDAISAFIQARVGHAVVAA